ncbi:hypothetical protein ACO0LF_14040 [Undibacterium sp. Di27W]|uniref:hypothetical protein n=1 Tax=Undibacterium sp. Di27W TaxID=3413036 RepID=UPI003BEFCA58
MTPTVFICNSISELLQHAGMGEHVPLSTSIPLDDNSASKLLKAAAPLCRDNWRIYVERLDDGTKYCFGVFCGSSDPASLSVDEVIFNDTTTEFPIVKIAQSAINKVEVRTSAGKRVEFRFNDDVDVNELNNQAHIQGLAKAISNGAGTQSELFSGFVERLLTSAIKNSHGTLIAVLPCGINALPNSLQDVVPLMPPVNLYERFARHIEEGKTATSVGRLQTAVELVSGFICSDGITIFNGSGNVLGYRAFIRSDATNTPSAGGARSRAYASMCSLIGSNLDAVFFRSQDGGTQFLQRTMDSTNE